MKNIAAFDAADYLDNDIVIAEYLNAALEDENPNVFLQAIADVAKARGMSKLAKDTGLSEPCIRHALKGITNSDNSFLIRKIARERYRGVEIKSNPS